MPNIKSAEKRVKVIKTKTLKNIIKKSSLKTAVRKCKEAISGNSSNATEILNNTASILDKAAAKNILHKNNAARKKSKLAKALNSKMA